MKLRFENWWVKALESLGKICYNNTPEREWVELLFGALNGSKRAKCGYPKSQDEVKYLTQYLKNSLDIVLDAKTFGASGKSDF